MNRIHGTVGALLLGVALCALLPQQARALPILSEVFYDAVGSDNGQSFVEIYAAPGTLLDGFLLLGVNGANGNIGPSVTLSGSVPADGLFVVADDAGDGTTSVANADLIANFDFQNGPDSVYLESGSIILDALAYGTFGVGEISVGEGAPAPDSPAGSSLARLFADVDSGDNAADFAILPVPTPGTAPLLAVPEPRTAVMVSVGLLTLAVLGGRAPGGAEGEGQAGRR